MNPLEAPCQVVLVRHAESEWNATGLWQGHADPPLSARGLEQARALAEALRAEPSTRLVCSDLQRARQTAAMLGDAWGLTAETDRQLRELDIGEWSGLHREEIVARDPEVLKRFEEGDPTARPGGGETRGEIRARARDAVEAWIRQVGEGRLVIVTHLGFIRALLPGEEPANAACVTVTAHDALTRRLRFDASEAAGRRESSPL